VTLTMQVSKQSASITAEIITAALVAETLAEIH
jgi:hypothetical protein